MNLRCQHLDLGFPDSRTMGNKLLLFEPPDVVLCYAAQGTKAPSLWWATCPTLGLSSPATKRGSQLFLNPGLLISGNGALVQEGPSPRVLLLSWLGIHKISKLSSILYVRSYRLNISLCSGLNALWDTGQKPKLSHMWEKISHRPHSRGLELC